MRTYFTFKFWLEAIGDTAIILFFTGYFIWLACQLWRENHSSKKRRLNK